MTKIRGTKTTKTHKLESALLQSFISIVDLSELTPDSYSGLFPFPWVTETDSGASITVPFNRDKLITIPPQAVMLLEQVADQLLELRGIAHIYNKQDIVAKLVLAVAKAVGRTDMQPADVLNELRNELREEVPPTITIVPMDGINIGDQPIDLGTVVFGRVGDAFESAVLAKNESHYGRVFSDDVVWTEDLLLKRGDLDLSLEASLDDLPVVMAVWTREQGHKSLNRVHEKVDMIFAIIVYIASMKATESFTQPHIMSTNEYVQKFQKHDEDAGYDEYELLRISSSRGRPEGIRFHKSPGKPIDLDALLGDVEHRDLASRLISLLEEQGKDWEHRLATHIHWCQIGSKASGAATAIMAFSIALEALVTPASPSDSMTRLIAERVALLLPEATCDERLALNKEIVKLYSVRSKLAHGQKLMLSWDEEAAKVVESLEGIVRLSGQNFLAVAQSSNWEKEADMTMWFDKRRFSLPA